MKTSTKWLLGIIIGVLIIGMGFFAWQKFGWRTYKNTTYGFSLKLDQNWKGYEFVGAELIPSERQIREEYPAGSVDNFGIAVPSKKIWSDKATQDPLYITQPTTLVVTFIIMTPAQWKYYQNDTSNQKSKARYLGKTQKYVILYDAMEPPADQLNDIGKKFYSTYIPELIKTFKPL